MLKAKGYQARTAPQRFIVREKYGPLKEGEIERALQWGKALAGVNL